MPAGDNHAAWPFSLVRMSSRSCRCKVDLIFCIARNVTLLRRFTHLIIDEVHIRNSPLPNFLRKNAFNLHQQICCLWVSSLCCKLRRLLHRLLVDLGGNPGAQAQSTRQDCPDECCYGFSHNHQLLRKGFERSCAQAHGPGPLPPAPPHNQVP